MNMESVYEYGSRAGFWRLRRMFQSRGLPVTVFGVATALARNPDAVAAMRESEWEVASHGWRWIDYSFVPPETERAHLRRALETHREVVGAAPEGWVCRADESEHPRLLLEMGDWLYDADSYADDLPHWVRGPRGPHLVVPYTLDANDMRFATGGFHNGEDFFIYLRDAYECLRAEEFPKMMSVGLHCRLAGRPGRARGLASFWTIWKSAATRGYAAAPTSPATGARIIRPFKLSSPNSAPTFCSPSRIRLQFKQHLTRSRSPTPNPTTRPRN